MIPAVETYGVTGMAAVVTGVYLFAIMPLDVHLAADAVETTNARLLSEVAYPTLSSVWMGAVVYGVRESIALDPVFEFAVLVATGALTYALGVLILETQFDWGLERDIRRVIDAVA